SYPRAVCEFDLDRAGDRYSIRRRCRCNPHRGKVRCRLRTCAKLPSPSIQLAWVYPSLASHRGHASARLQRRRYQPLLLLSRPATATLHRGDDFNRGLAHVTIPMNSHMTHTLTRSTRRPLSEGYRSPRCPAFPLNLEPRFAQRGSFSPSKIFPQL